MKRWLSLLLAVLLMCPCSAWAKDGLPERYEAAAALMVAGDYAGAAEAFSALTGYADAPQMAIYCRGLALMEAGDHDRAVKAFGHLGTFKDAPVMLIACQGAQARARGEKLAGSGSLMELVAAEPVLLEAAEYFDQIDYLPRMAAQAAECRALLAPLWARRFDWLDGASDGYCKVVQDGLYGIVDHQGQLIIPCEWEEIELHSDMLEVTKDGKRGLLSWSGEVISPCIAEEIHDSSWGMDGFNLYWYETVDGVAVQHVRAFLSDGTPLPEETWCYGKLSDELLRIAGAEGLGLYHVPTRTVLLPCTEQEWTVCGEGYVVLQQDGSMICHGFDGTSQAVPASAFPMTFTGLWRITDEKGCRLVDTDGRVLLEAADAIDRMYVDGLPDDHIVFRTQSAGVQQDHLMDGQGKVLLQLDSIDKAIGGRFVIGSREGWQYLFDLQKDAEPSVCARSISDVVEQRHVILTEGGVQYVLDLETGVRFEAPYKWIGSIGEGFLKAQKDSGKYVILRADGQRLTAEEYDYVSHFRNGYLRVERNDEYSLLDAEGNTVLSGYDSIMDYGYGYYIVSKKRSYGYRYDYSLLNSQLEVLLPPSERYPGMYRGLYLDERANELRDPSGKTVLDMDRFDDFAVDSAYIYTLHNGFLFVYDHTGGLVFGEDLN